MDIRLGGSRVALRLHAFAPIAQNMNDTAAWDKALAAADDPNALEPGDFDDSVAWAQMTALHWHLARSLNDLRIETASPELFKEGTAFASSRIMEKTADPERFESTLAFVVLSHFGDLVTVARCSDPTLLARLIDVLSAFGLRYVDHDYVAAKTYNGKCAPLGGLSWENRYFARVADYNGKASGGEESGD
jgi:hypothetical protein